jgi:hypothetical protein
VCVSVCVRERVCISECELGLRATKRGGGKEGKRDLHQLADREHHNSQDIDHGHHDTRY